MVMIAIVCHADNNGELLTMMMMMACEPQDGCRMLGLYPALLFSCAVLCCEARDSSLRRAANHADARMHRCTRCRKSILAAPACRAA
eukprot:6182490-Pleurochrysis_carterae.AAC.1